MGKEWINEYEWMDGWTLSCSMFSSWEKQSLGVAWGSFPLPWGDHFSISFSHLSSLSNNKLYNTSSHCWCTVHCSSPLMIINSQYKQSNHTDRDYYHFSPLFKLLQFPWSILWASISLECPTISALTIATIKASKQPSVVGYTVTESSLKCCSTHSLTSML